jgi:putative ABC transport system permease protein
MTQVALILRSLGHHWRAHLAAGLAAAVGTAVLVGALLVGDSVRYSLTSMAVERLGKVDDALIGGDRFFKSDLGVRLTGADQAMEDGKGRNSDLDYEPLLLVAGIVVNDNSEARAPNVQIYGIRPGFSKIGEHGPSALVPGEIAVNESLARALKAKIGDNVRVRLQKPSAVSQDAPLGNKEQNLVLIRATVKEILPDRGLGRFGFAANQSVPLNAFLPLIDLQEKLNQKDRANVLVHVGENRKAPNEALKSAWTLDDAQLRLRAEKKLGFLELTTPRVFLDQSVCDALKKDGASAVATYFVNGIRANGKETPYSMVTAGEAPLVPGDLKENEIVLTDWCAEDLAAKVGDKVEIEYYVVGLLRKLETRKAEFTVKAVVPIAGLQADRELMPDFPGIADVDSTHDWDSSVPIDMKKIRQKDEDYWKKYRGTPKAYIALKKGVELWQNRFGKYTALRFPLSGDAEKAKAELRKNIHETITPASVGLQFTPVRALALQASSQAIDFGMLFLGFSFFLIAAAVLLMALVFQFNIESRASETGLLLATGFTPKAVRSLLWREGVLMAAIGSLAGVAFGSFYAQAMLTALNTRWRDAVGTDALQYHGEPASLAIGCVSGVIVAALAIYFAVRKQASLKPRELLASTGMETPQQAPPSKWWKIIGGVCFVGGIGVLVQAFRTNDASAAEAFFSAGSMLLIALLAAVRYVVAERRTESTKVVATISSLGVRGATRRSGRSLATAALLACGSFLVVAVGANKQDAAAGADRKESGTGGFALYAKSTVPVFEDLNTPKGRANVGVKDEGLEGVTIYPFRVKAGDEASCLNLNRAQRPKILGVPESFIKRGGFTFVTGATDSAPAGWERIHDKPIVEKSILTSVMKREERICAICDFQSLTWALGKSTGDEIAVPDEKGNEQKIRVVCTIANSILQGAILISEDDFLKLYPSEGGYREFLIDAPPGKAAKVAEFLEASLQDEGFSATPAVKRLAEFNAVENTYLSTFQALGALGMLLGSLGLGIVVLRNVLERRGELAVLRAIGFSRGAIGWLVLSEHLWLLVLGLGAGVLAALPAVAPMLGSSSVPVPWEEIGLSLALIFGCGVFASVLATWAMLRAPLLAALRNE